MQRKKTVGLAVCAALTLVLSGASLLAADATTKTEATGPKIEASAVVPGTEMVIHEAGSASEEAKAILKDLAMMAFVDAETGALRAPTQEEVQKLATAGQQLQSIHARSRMQVQEFTTASGAVGAELPPELYAMSLVHVGEDGQLHYGCTDAEAAPGSSVVPVAQEEEK